MRYVNHRWLNLIECNNKESWSSRFENENKYNKSILLTKMKQSKLKIDFFSAFDLLIFWKDISRTNRPAVLRWKTQGITIAGNQLNYPYDLVVDDSNMYVTDSKNHRIMYWKKNAAQGVVVAGTGKQNSVLSLMKWNSFFHRRYYW